jgi:diguanylate cyclase (GGDEF)-like protein/PAS domain S-box-containing protein
MAIVLNRRASFEDEQRGLAIRLALLAAATCTGILILGVADVGVGIPTRWHLVALGMLNSGIALLCYRNVRNAKLLLPWLWGFAMPFIIVEPGITQAVDIAYMAVPILAFAVAGPITLTTMAILPVVILIARAPSIAASPYIESSFVTMHIGMTAVLLLLQRTLLRAQRHALQTESLAAAVAAASDDVVMVRELRTDRELRSAPLVRFLSPSIARMLGYQPADFHDRPLPITEFIHPSDLPMCIEHERQLIHDQYKSIRVECRLRHFDGRWIWFEVRSIVSNQYFQRTCVISAMRDISNERAMRDQQQSELAYQAQHDALTMLPNRWRLNRDLQQAFAKNKADVALLFCDIDSFKHINDSLGHEAGDELLCAVTSKLQPLCNEQRQLYRFGGDEFVFLVNQASVDDCLELAKIVEVTTSGYVEMAHNRVALTLSIGIAHAANADNANDLIRNADLAMYAAKAAGRNCHRVFDQSSKQKVMRRHAVEQALRQALQRDELSLVYQPKIEISSQRCVGFEALMRWHSPLMGQVSPGEFIHIAEETGLIVDIGRFAIRRACQEMASVCNAYDVSVSVNVSTGQMADATELQNVIAQALQSSGLAPQHLELEITESLFMKRPEQAISILTGLRTQGIRISVDDFGTGYSSLAYLRQFPIDCLKIDRTFVSAMVRDSNSHAIVGAILSLSRQLGLCTVAEGVELPAEMTALAQLGCDQAQGFIIAKPLPLLEARAFAATYSIVQHLDVVATM